MAPWYLNRQQRGSSSKRFHHDTPISSSSETSSPCPGSDKPPAISPALNDSSGDSSTDYEGSPSRHHRPFHVRSLSNSFPSLFRGNKRKERKWDSAAEVLSNADFPYDESYLPWSPEASGLQGDQDPDDMKAFTSGNCMTCGSTMRWPKEVDVFKCTICVTINDLVPLGTQDARETRPRGQDDSVSRIRNQPVSAAQARRIVRQCLQTYLLRQSGSRQQQDASTHARTGADRTANDTPTQPYHRHESYRGTGSSPGSEVYTPQFVFNEQPTLRPKPSRRSQSGSGHSSTAAPERPYRAATWETEGFSRLNTPSSSRGNLSKVIFKPLEGYIVDCFSSFDRINNAFFTHRTRHPIRSRSEYEVRVDASPRHSRQRSHNPPRTSSFTDPPAFPVDPKVLLLGDFAENGTWWAGGQDEIPSFQASSATRTHESAMSRDAEKSPDLNWGEVTEWYSIILNTANEWFTMHEELSQRPDYNSPSEAVLVAAERELLEAQAHVHRVLLKATETLLRRLGGQIKGAAQLRFLLIILENPLLHSNPRFFEGILQTNDRRLTSFWDDRRMDTTIKTGPLSGQHSGIIKRIVGLVSNAPDYCHTTLISWFSRYNATRFGMLKDLIYGFLTYRLRRQTSRNQPTKVDITAGLIPELHDGASEAQLYDEIRGTRGPQKPRDQAKSSTYRDDWQVKAAARVLSLLYAANTFQGGRSSPHRTDAPPRPPFLPDTDFYHSMIDLVDLVGDFDAWESRRESFSFCQYPFLLSIWAKTQILEHDAQRQMNAVARDAFFDSVMRRRNASQYLLLDVRRECLVGDSLKAVSEVIGSGSEDVKKALRISFRGEEGIDGGGLRKEWFLLLAREVFNPTHGLFLYDEESHYCYFNPFAFETSDQFYLVGVVMGLAIYNSTILDIALPPFAFRKLLAAAPITGGRGFLSPKQGLRYTLEDLQEYRPSLARGLRDLLEFEGNAEDLGLDFTITMDKYGAAVQVPLCSRGDQIPVTNANRREYVDLYIRYLLDKAVARQFEPFKRGFYTICGGNAFSLFRPSEIELLVRGSDEALDIASLRANAEYDNWGEGDPDIPGSVVAWFWETFQDASLPDQRRMLSFITGSDRLPATGASIMPIKVSCLGDDCGRYPMARTCFNFLSLWKYSSKQRLESFLWRAVHESEGFGLK